MRDQRVAGRRAQVEHHVGVVEQPRAARVPAPAAGECATEVTAMTCRPRAPGAHGHLDRHGRGAAGAEHHHRVGRAQVEVGQDRLGQPLDALDEHRLALAVGADDLRVEGHRELDHRVEARDRSRSAGTSPRPGCASGPCRTGARGRRRRSRRRRSRSPAPAAPSCVSPRRSSSSRAPANQRVVVVLVIRDGGVDLHRLPAPVLHRAIAGVQHAVDDVAVDERLARLGAGSRSTRRSAASPRE